MVLILSQRYKDAPAVPTELVKFLPMNTSVETMDMRIKESVATNSTLSKLSKVTDAADKTLTTVGNKHDRLVNECSDIKKRMTNMEQKNDTLS